MAFATKKKTPESGRDYPVGTALGLSEGDKIDEITGTLKSVFDVKQAGKSTVQNGILSTEHGDIKIAVWGTELPKSLKGAEIKILATNKKFGDVTYKYNEYDGKSGHVKEEILNIGNNADIEEVDPAEAGGKEEAAKHGMEQPVKDSKVVYDQPVRPKGGYSLLDAAESLCIQHLAVHDMVHATYAKKNLTDAAMQAYVASVWIFLRDAGVIIIGNHPQSSQEARGDTGTAKQAPATTQPSGGQESDCNPQNWAECVVPAGPLMGKKLGEVGKKVLLQFEEARLEKEAVGVVPKFPAFTACVKQAAIDLEFNPEAADGDTEPF